MICFVSSLPANQKIFIQILGSILVYLAIWVGWIASFATTLQDCYYKVIQTQESLYLGELAWNSESVALNYVMLNHRTCNPVTAARWENSIWFENMLKLSEICSVFFFAFYRKKTENKIFWTGDHNVRVQRWFSKVLA